MVSDDGLQTLVAQHFERLDKILTNTIKQLEELKACIPNVLKSEQVFYTGSGGTLTKHVGHIKGHPCTNECGLMQLPFIEGLKYYTEESTPIPVPHTSDGNCVCDGKPPE